MPDITSAGYKTMTASVAIDRNHRSPGDVAATVAFLAPDGAAALTGQAMCAGGRLVQRQRRPR
jgi:NAD(P)-dependent dehydrogenase (short-subunit alcohol dehydrogenase family)